jgi:hypothetical protein
MKKLTKRETKKQVKKALDYLLTEGVVVKVGHRYRMKTKKEIEAELKEIENARH